MRNLLHSLFTFILALFFILIGFFGMLLPWMPTVRTNLILFFLEKSIAIFIFGLGLVAIGVGIVVSIALQSKRNTYQSTVGGHPVEVDEQLIHKYLENYWKELFPENEIPNRLVVKNNRLHVWADLPLVPLIQQEALVDRIKNDLRELFGQTIGYHKQFYLTATFPSETSKNK